MIEFNLVIYMCSHCTRVHNAAQDCLRHELDEHATANASKTNTTVDRAENGDSAAASTTSLPFTIADDDVKPDVEDSYMHRYSTLDTVADESQEPMENEIVDATTENINEASSVVGNLDTKSEEKCVDLPSTSRPLTRRQPTKTSIKKSVKPSSTTTHDLKKKTVTYPSDRKIPCGVCKKMILPRFMVAHIRTHTGEKPFKCRSCPKQFSVKWSRQEHEKRQHNFTDPGHKFDTTVDNAER